MDASRIALAAGITGAVTAREPGAGLSAPASAAKASSASAPEAAREAARADASPQAANQPEGNRAGAYYTNPIFVFDSATGAVVREWRDSRTGETEYRIPSRRELLYRQLQETSERTEAAGEESGRNVSADQPAGNPPGDKVSLVA
ncbi:MAG: hypothetical protein FJX42_08840 [Alphaproteobacteria bacterium]|nr:hypothetical protein [Alphaproteobacteria bacterium]